MPRETLYEFVRAILEQAAVIVHRSLHLPEDDREMFCEEEFKKLTNTIVYRIKKNGKKD